MSQTIWLLMLIMCCITSCPQSNGYLQHDKELCHKAKVSQTGFIINNKWSSVTFPVTRSESFPTSCSIQALEKIWEKSQALPSICTVFVIKFSVSVCLYVCIYTLKPHRIRKILWPGLETFCPHIIKTFVRVSQLEDPTEVSPWGH